MTLIMYSMYATVTIIVLLVIYYYFWFLRNPVREIAKDPNAVVSPTDGKIVNILEFKDNKVKLKKGWGTIKTTTKEVAKEGYIIQIMMTPLDVHFQRTPIEGEIVSVKHTKGKLKNAVTTQNMDVLENEKTEVVLKGTITVKMIQVAGFLARRIHCWVKKSEKVLKGEQYGVIKLGSQVILIVPKIKLDCKLDDYVYGGSTILGWIKK